MSKRIITAALLGALCCGSLADVVATEAVDRVVEPFTISKNTIVLRGLDRFVALNRADAPDADVLVTMPLVTVVDLYVTCLEPGALYSVETQGGAKVRVHLKKDPHGSARVSESGILAVNLELLGLVKERR